MDIIGIGTPIMDLVVNVDSMPQKDGATHANEMFYQGGNKVPTAMVAAARLGWKAGLMGRVGRDRIGRFILEDLEYNHVDISRVLLDEEGRYSSCCLSLSEKETGTRVFIGRSSTVRPITPDLLDYDYLATAKCIHLSEGDEGSAAAAAFGKEKGNPLMGITTIKRSRRSFLRSMFLSAQSSFREISLAVLAWRKAAGRS